MEKVNVSLIEKFLAYFRSKKGVLPEPPHLEAGLFSLAKAMCDVSARGVVSIKLNRQAWFYVCSEMDEKHLAGHHNGMVFLRTPYGTLRLEQAD